MNNYPIWWDKTITIYNRVVDSTTQRVSWHRTTVDNCFWKYVNNTYYIGARGVSVSGISLESKDVICRIPKDERFVKPGEWSLLDNYDEYFTLNTGDIIILGEVDDEIDDYTAGQRSTDIINKYKALQECIQVETYVVNTGTGVGMEHYRIVGA